MFMYTQCFFVKVYKYDAETQFISFYDSLTAIITTFFYN